MTKQKKAWVLKSEKLVYDNPWISVVHHDVIDPSGEPGIYGKVHFKNIAIAVLALDDDRNTWIVGQSRYVLQQYSWEIPEGGCPLGSEPLDSAKRELQEETGIVANSWELIGEADISNSVSDESAFMFVARDLSFTNQNLDSTEDIQVKRLPLDDLYEMIMNGEIRDSLTIMTVLKYCALYPTK